MRASAAAGDLPPAGEAPGEAPLLELAPTAGASVAGRPPSCCLAATATVAIAATLITASPTRLGLLAAGAAAARVACEPHSHCIML